MNETNKKILEQALWNIANTLRGKMDADEFRDYILGFIFYKYLSERFELYANNESLKNEGVVYMDLKPDMEIKPGVDASYEDYIDAVRSEAQNQLGYFLYPNELFKSIAAKGSMQDGADNFILDELSAVLDNIEKSTTGTESENDFDKLFEDLDLQSTKLGRTAEARNEIICKILEHLSKIDFELENSDSDILGDAYEYLIGQFASSAGKKAGEFYTPQAVSTILSKLVTVGKDKLRSVYDPTCGSGSLLLRVAKEVKGVSDFYGQELNRTTYNLARMNMLLHGVPYRNFDIKQEDTLKEPQHFDKRFEAIVANPPFSAQWSANQQFLTDDRFSQYGKLAPKSKADFAFIQHMIHQLADNGVMAVVMPHGVLFRGAAEGHIRKYLIADRNYLDAVIGLPANIFYGTSIPTAILVFKKCREHSADILFIDASQNFEKAKNQNYLRPADIDRIVDTYTKREAIAKYSYVAKLSEIEANDYNLNIPRYVDTFEEEEPIDIGAVTDDIKNIDKELVNNQSVIAGCCEELGIKMPF